MDKQHKQKAPLLVAVPETRDRQQLSELPTSDQMQMSESYGNNKEDGRVPDLEGTVPMVGGDVEDIIETEPVCESGTKEGDLILQEHTKTKEHNLLPRNDEGKLKDTRSPPETEQAQEATVQVCVHDAVCEEQPITDLTYVACRLSLMMRKKRCC